MPPRSSHFRSGFTLVELSIALVIIGLIIGGVLVGRDLIRAAQVNAGIHQIEGYQASVNNFKLRYRGLPGDMHDATSQFSNSKWPELRNGDGNGVLLDPDGNITKFSGELPQFWYQLSAAGMVDSQYDNGYTLGESFPRSKAGNGGIAAYGVNDIGNFFFIGMVTPTNTATQAVRTQSALTPEEAMKMDQKIDDGHPLQGTVTAAGGTNFATDPKHYEVSWLPPIPASSPVALAYNTVGEWFVSSAHALHEDEEVSASRDACVFTTSTGGDDAAHYASGAGAVTCQLRIRWK